MLAAMAATITELTSVKNQAAECQRNFSESTKALLESSKTMVETIKAQAEEIKALKALVEENSSRQRSHSDHVVT